MTATLPDEVQQVFARFITTEFTAFDASGLPITWPVTPYYSPGGPTIDVTTGVGYPKKANDARANPKVALLFSEPFGSGLENPPLVLVQGTAEVDDADLDANAERYGRESVTKLPATKKMMPPKLIQRTMGWYFKRLYVKVRPERVYLWPGGDIGAEPALLDTHLEEVRSTHAEEPETAEPGSAGGESVWDERIGQLGDRYDTAVLSVTAPDGFPFSLRVPVSADRDGGRVGIAADPVGAPLRAGRACLTAHDHGEEFEWQRNFQVRGDLVEDGDGWALIPRKLVGGFELPPGSPLQQMRVNARKMLRYRKIAKREIAAIEARRG
jgi:hypothetical protein